MAQIRLHGPNGVVTTYSGSFDVKTRTIKTADGRCIHPAPGDRIEVEPDRTDAVGVLVVVGVLAAVWLVPLALAAILAWARQHPILVIGGFILLIGLLVLAVVAVIYGSSSSDVTPATTTTKKTTAGSRMLASPNTRVVRIFVASPSDVSIERNIASEVIEDWNITHSTDFRVILHAVRWESASFPQLKDRPQAVVNTQLLDNCDALVGLFWTRLGTPTGQAESGTVEEIDSIRAAGKPVMLYFSRRPIVPHEIDFDQYRRLKAFRNQVEATGLVEEFDTHEELRIKMLRHFSALARRYRTEGDARRVAN